VVRLATTGGERALDEEAFFEELQRIPQRALGGRWTRPRPSPVRVRWPGIGSPARSTKNRNLAATRGKVGLEERRVLLDGWVPDVLIVVEPIPWMMREPQHRHHEAADGSGCAALVPDLPSGLIE
jgi:hypothetical protein